MKALLLVFVLALAGATWWALAPSGATSSAKSFATESPAAGLPGVEATSSENIEDAASGGPYWTEAWDALEAGEAERAQALIDAYLTSEPASAPVYEMLSTLARRSGDPITAVDYAQKAVALEPERSMAHVALTRAKRTELMGLNPFKAMLQLGPLKDTMTLAVELDPTNDEALIDQAYFALYAPGIAGGDFDLVRTMIELLDAVDPEQARTLEVQLLAREEEVDAAIALARSSLETYPESQLLHVSLGMILLEAERLEEAEVEFRAAHEGPSLASGYNADYQLAKLLIQDERNYEEALELLEGFLDGRMRADLMMPEAGAHWRKGLALEGLGRVEEARASYQEALLLDEDLEQARESLDALNSSP